MGRPERVAVRLVAARVPDAVVNERRRQARAKAKKRGSTPSQAPLSRLAGNLFLPTVPRTVWTPATVCTAYTLRGQGELGFKSWKSYLPRAALPTKTQEPTLCYLSGRLLLIGLIYALCPALRTALWANHRRELSLLKLVRCLQALAATWLQRLLASSAARRAFLHPVSLTAERLVTKAVRKRRTSAQRLRESRQTQNGFIKLTIKFAA